MRNFGRRLRGLTPRQACVLAAGAVLGGAAMVAALAGPPAVALALLAPLGVAPLVTMVQLGRRLERLRWEVRGEVARTREQVQQRVSHQTELILERADVAHRRLLATVEHERLVASDRQHELVSALERSVAGVAKQQREQTQETEALLQLYRDFRPRAPMPPLGQWAMNPLGMLALLSLIEQRQPKLVLELGSGTSSVWISYALERTGGRLISVDHASEFLERTRSALSLHGLDQVAEVRHAPLRPCTVAGREFRWYDQDAFTGLGDVPMLVVDGPPRATGPAARYPAFPLLQGVLAAKATIVLDDADRPDEAEIVGRWLADCSTLTRHETISPRHAVLSYSRY